MIYTVENTKFLFYSLEACQGVRQRDDYHPEGDVFTHSLQVLHYAFRESTDTCLILAGMLHDVGKVINPFGHEDIACTLLKEHVSQKTLFLIEHHLRIRTYLDGKMQKHSSCLFLAQHPYLTELVQLTRWDRAGRKKGWTPKYDKQNIIDRLNTLSETHFKKKEELGHL